ncbi:MAG: type I-E CRISPR-associated protein Cse1/CasA, partial [Chloroflexales bacterium]|nr:type I-E CRISPR-associated protein Cse1/CasA [Chloroflexales bacterium]
LNDDDAGAIVEQALQRANDVEHTIRFAFDRHFRPRRSLGDKVKAELTRYKTVRARMSASYWQWLAPEFRSFVFSLGDEAARETRTREWVRTLTRVAQKSFDQAAEQLGVRADALRARVIAQDSCRQQLAITRKEWLDE